MNNQQLELITPSDTTATNNRNEKEWEFLRAIDKGELHVHLNGAIPTTTVREILADELTKIPSGFDLQQDLTRLTASQSLADYLTPWQVLRLFPRKVENLNRLAEAAISALSGNQVRFAEIRSSVIYLASLQGCTITQALERLILSTGAAAERHGMRRGLILTVTRGDYSAVNLTSLLDAYNELGRPQEVIGIDLAGDEEMPYPKELPSLFRDAKNRYGLGITVHAGETGRVENIRNAVELFGADRIGHGTAAAMDAQLMEILAKRDICVEVCPISNRLTGAVPYNEAHPLQQFRKHGVPFVICSDNPAIHQRGLIDDQVVAMVEGLPFSVLQEQYDLAKRYSFMKG